MPCVTRETAADCIADHWLPNLDGRAEPAGGRAPCPVCGTLRALLIQTPHGRVVWNAFCDPPCDREAISAAIAERVACYSYSARGRRQHAPDLDELRGLLTDPAIPPAARQVAGLRALGISETDIRRDLKVNVPGGLSRATYYRAVSFLRQKPRSRSHSPNPRTNPQVRRAPTGEGGLVVMYGEFVMMYRELVVMCVPVSFLKQKPRSRSVSFLRQVWVCKPVSFLRQTRRSNACLTGLETACQALVAFPHRVR